MSITVRSPSQSISTHDVSTHISCFCPLYRYKFKGHCTPQTHICSKSFTFTNRCTYLLVLESTKIYIKILTKMLLHVSVCDHHKGACTWA